MKRSTSAGLVLALSGLALGGCSSGGAGATPGPMSSSAPSATAAPSASASATADCINITNPVEVGRAPTDVQAQMSDVVVVGTFKGFGQPKWNTPDGLRPPKAAFAHGIGSATIFRPLKVKTDESLKGDVAKMTRAYELGGQLGCDQIVYPIAPDLTVGQRYVFFLWPVGDVSGNSQGDLALGDAFPIADDGTVTRSVEEPISLDALTSEIASGLYPTPTPAGPVATPTEDPNAPG